MVCPRCDSDTVEFLIKAPEKGIWEIYKCKTCNFTWRSTEPEDITDPGKYDKRFKINPSNISHLDIIPPIPKLIK